MWLVITTYVVDNYHMLILHSKTRQRLLRFYFTNLTARLHVRDLAHRLDVDPSNLSKELRHLESEGLFASETSGRQKYFHLNRKYPLLAESLQRIDGIQEAYLYGSFARNQQDVASDIDVIVIGNPKGTTLAEVIRSLEHQLGREINYTVLTRKEFDSRRARKDAFLEDIWHNERLALVGPA
jgi:predicted nucleotidyltransferase